jgi:hypothetical protein
MQHAKQITNLRKSCLLSASQNKHQSIAVSEIMKLTLYTIYTSEMSIENSVETFNNSNL